MSLFVRTLIALLVLNATALAQEIPEAGGIAVVSATDGSAIEEARIERVTTRLEFGSRVEDEGRSRTPTIRISAPGYATRELSVSDIPPSRRIALSEGWPVRVTFRGPEGVEATEVEVLVLDGLESRRGAISPPLGAQSAVSTPLLARDRDKFRVGVIERHAGFDVGLIRPVSD